MHSKSERHNWRWLAAEGGRVGLRMGSEDLGLEQIVGIVHLENAASRRVLKKLRLTFDLETVYFGMPASWYVITREAYRLAADAFGKADERMEAAGGGRGWRRREMKYPG